MIRLRTHPLPPRLRGIVAVFAAGLGAAACGGGKVDHEDEGGAPGDTRVELVYVEADSQRTAPAPAADTVAQVSGGSAPTTSPANGAGTGDGGEDAIPYDPKGQFAVQVGVFADATRASERVGELVALGYPAYASQHDQGTRVRIGYFAAHDQAERFGQRFSRDHGGTYWIDRRDTERRASR